MEAVRGSGGGNPVRQRPALSVCVGDPRPAVTAGRRQRDLRGGLQGGVEREGGGHQEHRERLREERLSGGGTVKPTPPNPSRTTTTQAHTRARAHSPYPSRAKARALNIPVLRKVLLF